MNEEEGDRKIDLDTVEQITTAKYEALMKANQRMQLSARRRAQILLDEADKFDEMASAYRDIAAMHVGTAQALSDGIFHLLNAEFDLSVEEIDDAPDDSDDSV